MGRPKLYTEEELKERKRVYQAKWRAEHKEYNAKWRAENHDYKKEYYSEHKDEIAEKNAKYYQEHKEEIAVKQTKYRKTPMGRAAHIVGSYRRNDKKYNRGKCTLTAQWIVENIFTKPCHYCGAMGWEIMGCDRIDNSLPHTPDNVVPCCGECNAKRHTKSYEDFVSMFKINKLWQN